MSVIQIKLPDDTIQQVEQGSTSGDIARSIGEGLFRASIAAKINGDIVDLEKPLEKDTSVEILTNKNPEAHEILLHSTAHLMAQAVKELYPSAKIAIGPALEDRFYYDFDIDVPINEQELNIIEKKMKEIAKCDLSIYRMELSRNDALGKFNNLGEDYKVEIISAINENDVISAYQQGKFIDICRGPHVPSTGKIKYFKLLTSAGAYWRGNEKNKMLQRIYGTAWFTKEDLDGFLHRLEEAKKRDHRRLGRELEIYAFDDEVGPGLPLWLPNGTIIIEEIENLAKETEKKAGYQRVRTPHLTKGDLYIKSGHLEHYEANMYPAMNIDDISYYVKPMNCPHHHKIFSAVPKSYRDMPVRLAEYGTCYRYEKTGQLFGLMRVRSMQMNDAHIYCTEKQFKDEFLKVCNMYLYYFDIFGINKYQMRLSLHDPENLGEKYVDEPELWIKTEELVRESLIEGNIPYEEISGEAAFYGPKIDVQVWSAIGREFTLATNQVDFAIPKRFKLTYVDEHNDVKNPLCIHRAPLGTHERFIGFLIEHFGGDFPLWLTPRQVIILPISEKYLDYAESISNMFQAKDIRVSVDIRSEKVGAKIRDAELKKIPVMLVVGEKEEKEGTVSVRRRHSSDLKTLLVEELISKLVDEIKTRRRE